MLFIFRISVDSMRKIAVADKIIVEIFHREVRKHTTISKLVASQQDLPSVVIIMNEIVSPLLFPSLSLEAYGERASHLNSTAYCQVRGCFIIEEPQNFILKINRSAG